MSQITPSSFTIADGTVFNSYLRDGGQIAPDAIEEFVVLRIFNIPKGTGKRISFSFLEFPVTPLSLYALRGDTSTDDSLDINLYYGTDLLGTMPLTEADIPYKFPCFVITPELELEIVPKFSMAIAFLYFHPCSIIQQQDIQ